MRPSRGPASRGGGQRIVQSGARLPRRGSDTVKRGGRGSHTLTDHNRRMENIASVSRSSGLEKDGDLLKEKTVQEEFRVFIDKKLRTFWDQYGTDGPLSAKSQVKSAPKQKKDNQENILILFRKLREGLFASGRKDGFVLEVYETSLYLSVVFDSPAQTTSILSRLVPDIYSATLASQPFRLVTILVLLLHQLVISFPSQRVYLEQIRHLVSNLLERPSPAYEWISALAQSLRTLNFVQFERLSQPDAFEHLLPSSPPSSNVTTTTATMINDLPRSAVFTLISRLRWKARDKAWTVVRIAYRELSSVDETRKWLEQLLFFDSFGSEATAVRFHEWMEERCQDGQLRPKEGVKGRWIVCKAR